MTTTVVVKARAWGATVVAKTDDNEAETLELGSHEDRSFHIQSGSKMTIEVSEPAEAPVAEEPLDTNGTAQTEDAPITDETTAAVAGDAAVEAEPKKAKNFGRGTFGEDA